MADLQSLAYAPGTMREYETIYILKPDTIGDNVAEVNGRVRSIIEEGGGKILKVDNWGKRRLAYEIKKERKGVYLYWQYLGSPSIVKEFERNLRMLDPVIRYLTVRLDENVDPEARPTDVDAETFERAAITAADEEDEMLARAGEEGEEGEEGEAAAEGETAEGETAEGETAAAAADGEAAEGEAAEGETAEAAEAAEAPTETETASDDSEKGEE